MKREIFSCQPNIFLNHYGPRPVGSEDVQACIDSLYNGATTSDGTVIAPVLRKTPQPEWRAFPVLTKDNVKPSQDKANENTVFKPLFDIIDAIYAYDIKEEGREKNEYRFQLCPQQYLDADIDGTYGVIDGCIVEKEWHEELAVHKASIQQAEHDSNGIARSSKRTPSVKLPVSRIVVPCEFKKKRTPQDRHDAHTQILGAAHHILNDDPRRMWIYGITIEDDRMSMWFFSRSHSVKSRSFNWLTDIEIFVQMWLMFAYASSSELGLDPYVHKVSNDGSYIYEVDISNLSGDEESDDSITIDNHKSTGAQRIFYKTVKSLFPSRSMCISDRMTRVWMVTQVHSLVDTSSVVEGKYAVLKDVWLDGNKPTEAENQQRLFAAVDAFVANSDWKSDKRLESFSAKSIARLETLFTKKKYKSLFLTEVHAWKGRMSKAVAKDAWLDPELFTPLIPKQVAGSLTCQATVAPTTTILQPIAETEKKKNPPSVPRLYTPKQQSRFVYDEVCKPLHELSTIGEVMNVLQETLIALQVLFCAGWVHRDISTGNILAYPSSAGWSVKLADLEFAQPFAPVSESRSDPRTGTPHFMPHEILAGHYLLDNYIRQSGTSDSDELPDAEELSGSKESSSSDELPGSEESSSSDELPDFDEFILASQLNLREGPWFEALNAYRGLPYRLSIPQDADHTKIPAPGTAVLHNFQHDLESVWWIMLWFITMCVNHHPSHAYGTPIFTNASNFPLERQNAFTVGLLNITYLHPHLRSGFMPVVTLLRKAMERAYLERAAFGKLAVHAAYSNIHAVFIARFKQLFKTRKVWATLPVNFGIDELITTKHIYTTASFGANTLSTRHSINPSAHSIPANQDNSPTDRPLKRRRLQ